MKRFTVLFVLLIMLSTVTMLSGDSNQSDGVCYARTISGRVTSDAGTSFPPVVGSQVRIYFNYITYLPVIEPRNPDFTRFTNALGYFSLTIGCHSPFPKEYFPTVTITVFGRSQTFANCGDIVANFFFGLQY